MTSHADIPATRPGSLARTEAWFDARGRAALMVAGWVLSCPAGLVVLAYTLWTRKLSDRGTRPGGGADRAGTRCRIEDARQTFEGVLRRLRAARDTAEFDHFTADRGRSRPNDAPTGA